MKRAAVAALVLALPATAFAASASARLRLVDRSPLVVRGTGFVPRERVRVQVTGAVTATTRVAASAQGSLTARFARVAVTRCDRVVVVAVGSRSGRVVLKLLPAPGCIPG